MIAVEPLTGAVGAVVRGVQLREVDDPTDLRALLLRHLVLFFPDQELTPEQHVRFASLFGEVLPPPVDSGQTPPAPGVLVLDQVAPVGAGTDRWHADSTFLERPPLGAVLRAVQLPEVGGDTLFASMYAAYESLSEPLRTMLDGLTAVHSSRLVDELMGVERVPLTFVHPVVRVHPETGRRLLFVNGNWTTRIVELSLEESDGVLRLLFDHLRSPILHCRFRWTPGAVAFWDNRAVQHFAAPDYDERRVMHRVLLAGDRPVGVGSAS